MAILPTPSIKKINAFDPNFEHKIEFSYIGNQSVRNRAIVTDNDTGLIIYDCTITTLELCHTIPAKTLSVGKKGKQYLIQIQVSDTNGNSSNLSDPILFYCFTNPVFTFEQFAEPYVVRSIDLLPTYYQSEGESLKFYQYKLFDGNYNLLNSSDVYYGDIEKYTFSDLKSDHYYVQCIGETIHGMSVDTGKKLLKVNYNIIPPNASFELKNRRCSGDISLRTNMLKYELENDNYIFNEDGSITLLNNSLTYKDGFSLDEDFVLYIEAKKLPVGTFLRTWNDVLTLSILNVCGKYYCEFKSGEYVLYEELSEELLSNNTYMTFELKRINNIYNLRVYNKGNA